MGGGCYPMWESCQINKRIIESISSVHWKAVVHSLLFLYCRPVLM
jgi:hypothetical protein